MAQEIHSFAFTIPAGTAIATPVTQALTMPQREVTAVGWKVPPGPRGLVGWQLGAVGNQIIPAIIGNWVITDNEGGLWPLENYIDSGAWEAFGYNLGQYSHTIQFRFLCTVPGLAPTSTTNLIDLSTLTSN